jgi:hypothetical protein
LYLSFNLVFEKLNSELVNDQFKNLRNNINLELENVIDEEDDSEYIEDEDFIMKPRYPKPLNKMSPGRNKNTSIEDISRLENFTKRMRQKTEELIFDNSVDNKDKGIIYGHEIEIKLKDENTKEGEHMKEDNTMFTQHKVNSKLATLNGDHEMPSESNNNFKEINTAPIFRSMRSHDVVIKKSLPHLHQHEVKCNCKGKFDEYNKHISLFMSKLIKLCQTCSQMVKWMDQSYRWIEERYLKNSIKDTKKSLLKRSKVQEYLFY